MNDEVTRWWVKIGEAHSWSTVCEGRCIEYVLASDYERLTAECERLRAELNKPACTDDEGTWHNPDDLKLIAALRESAKLAEAVAEAAEEYVAANDKARLEQDISKRVFASIPALEALYAALTAWRSHRAKSLEGGEGK